MPFLPQRASLLQQNKPSHPQQKKCTPTNFQRHLTNFTCSLCPLLPFKIDFLLLPTTNSITGSWQLIDSIEPTIGKKNYYLVSTTFKSKIECSDIFGGGKFPFYVVLGMEISQTSSFFELFHLGNSKLKVWKCMFLLKALRTTKVLLLYLSNNQ